MCQVLEEFVQIMKSYKVKDYRAYATSAMREAHNRQIILDQIRVRTGLTVRIISNSEQRFISYKAIAAKAAELIKLSRRGPPSWMWDSEARSCLLLTRILW